MTVSKSKAADSVVAAMVMSPGAAAALSAKGFYELECRGPDGEVKWTARSHNLVVNVGLKDMNDKYFTGAAYTASWFIGLYGSGATNNPVSSDQAGSHPGWVEVVLYSSPTRPAAVFAAATEANPSIITNAAAPAIYNINGTGVVGGAFLISNNIKGGNTGLLFSASDSEAPGDRGVALGDIINATYRFELLAT